MLIQQLRLKTDQRSAQLLYLYCTAHYHYEVCCGEVFTRDGSVTLTATQTIIIVQQNKSLVQEVTNHRF